ncbi:MAG TPA: ATP-binding protein [Mucilaginibacter sp.]|jgi:signal transduction histidine kinase
MKKSLLFILCLTTFCNFAFAQNKTVDSLQKAYQENKQDTTLVQLLDVKAIRVYLQTNSDSGLLCARQGLAISRRIHYKYGEVRSLANIASYLDAMGDIPGALRITFEVLPQAIQIKDAGTIAECYNTLGLTYSKLNDLKKANENYHKALTVVERAHMYQQIVIENNNLCRNFLDQNKVDSALWYNNKAYTLSLEKHLEGNIGFLIRNFGIIEFKKGNYAKAIDYYNKSVAQIGTKNNHYLQNEDYRRMAEAYQKLNKLDSCIYFAKMAYEEGKLDHNPETIMKTTALLTDVYKSRNDFKSAFEYQQIMLKAKDSLFSQQKTLQVQSLTYNEEQKKRELEAAAIAYQNKVRFYALFAVLGVFVLVAFILLYANSQRKKANLILQQRNEQIETQHKSIEKTLAELKTTQTQLIQSEKMASLGELTAGIAHEIQNPLNFVNNFSEVNTELVEEMELELDKGNLAEARSIATDIKENQQKINQHGKRADFIVKGMLEHSRTSKGEKTLTNINVLADEFLKLSYHGLRAKDKNFNAELLTNFDETLPKVEVVQQDIGRVLLNLFNNAFYAVNQKKKTAGTNYKPQVSVATVSENGHITIKVKDNGNGIPESVKGKIMQPFFTTKPTGEGTGLGLSLSYDIVVKGHNGTIEVDSKENIGSEFKIKLPVT